MTRGGFFHHDGMLAGGEVGQVHGAWTATDIANNNWSLVIYIDVNMIAGGAERDVVFEFVT